MHNTMEVCLCSRSNMTEALEWLIEHQDDSDDEEDDGIDFLSVDTTTDSNIASPSSSLNTKKKSSKDACLELFEIGNSCIKSKYALLFRR